MIVYYSLGNRKYWFTTIERLIEIAEILAKKSYLLYDVEAINSIYNDWFILNDNYTMKLADLIDSLIEENFLDDEITSELERLREVLKGGYVVMG